MAAYAKIYGFQVVDRKHIKGREEEYTWLGDNCYLSNSEYEMLEETIRISIDPGDPAADVHIKNKRKSPS